MKYLISLLKNIIMAPVAIYLYNVIVGSLGCLIPINIITVIVVGLLGIPGLIMLIIFFVFVI